MALPIPLATSQFSLDIIAVAGLFGGEEAILAMRTIHLYKGRRWLGWYNSPGSYTIASRFCRMSMHRSDTNDSLAVLFGLDGRQGPKYVGSSGAMMATGHLAHLTMEQSKELAAIEVVEGRMTKPVDITYLAMKHVDNNAQASVQRLPITQSFIALIPIASSVTACTMCALVYDWLSFSVILVGIICSGLTSLSTGRGKLVIKEVRSLVSGSPEGYGILLGERDIMVIKGKERDVNTITKGRFYLETVPETSMERIYHANAIYLSPLIQFLVQLILVPQGSLFGQIMFLASFIISWVYNFYLSLLDQEKIQTDLLFQTLGNPEMRRFRVGTRVTAVVLTCLLLFHGVDDDQFKVTEERRIHRIDVLRSLLPNDTPVWRRWMNKVSSQLLAIDYEMQILPFLDEVEEDQVLSEVDRRLLNQLLQDAVAAFKFYFTIHDSLPADSSQQTKGRYSRQPYSPYLFGDV